MYQVYHIKKKQVEPMTALVLFIIFYTQLLSPFSLIYNMKVRRSLSTASLVSHPTAGMLDLNAIPIFAHEKIYLTSDNLRNKESQNPVFIEQQRNNEGALLNINYHPLKNWWVEAGTEVAHEAYSNTGTSHAKNKRTGCDDIVFTSGYDYTYKHTFGITAYGLAGVPTLRKITQCDMYGPVLGTRLFSTGAGLEFAYLPFKSPDNTVLLLFQARCIHFYTRHWAPVLPCDDKLAPGNQTDLLWAINYKHKKMVYEAGYNLTLHTNQAVITPQETTKGSHYTYNGYYAIVSRPLQTEQPILCSAGAILAHSNYLNALRYSLFFSLATAF